MKETGNAAVNAHNRKQEQILARARQALADLNDPKNVISITTVYPLKQYAQEMIIGPLNSAKIRLSALAAPEEKKTDEEMAAEISRLVEKEGRLTIARHLYEQFAELHIDPYDNNLTATMQEIESGFSRITGALKRIGVGPEALDPKHKRTAEDMTNEMRQRKINAYLKVADTAFTRLSEMVANPQNIDDYKRAERTANSLMINGMEARNSARGAAETSFQAEGYDPEQTGAKWSALTFKVNNLFRDKSFLDELTDGRKSDPAGRSR